MTQPDHHHLHHVRDRSSESAEIMKDDKIYEDNFGHRNEQAGSLNNEIDVPISKIPFKRVMKKNRS